MQDHLNKKYKYPIIKQRLRLDYIDISIIPPDQPVLQSHNMVLIVNTLEVHKKFLHTYPKIMNLTSHSTEIINMLYITST